jgi:hypothetical protein
MLSNYRYGTFIRAAIGLLLVALGLAGLGAIVTVGGAALVIWGVAGTLSQRSRGAQAARATDKLGGAAR